MADPIKILVVDDEESLRNVVSMVLSDDGHEVTAVASGEAALEAFHLSSYSLVITDIRMDGMNGIELLEEIKRIEPDTQVVVMTSHASLDSSIMALKSGAYDYLLKPFEDLDVISAVVNRAIEKIQLIARNQDLFETLKRKNEALDLANQTLKEQAIRDGLTGLLNHRYFQEALLTELSRCKRIGLVLSLIFLDVDFFKKYNDTYGHQTGDRVLKLIGEHILQRVRKEDIVARYGGEEFVVILTGTSKVKASVVAEDIRSLIEENPFPQHEGLPAVPLTVSLGIASFPEDALNAEKLINVADRALYRAKHAGRNQVALA